MSRSAVPGGELDHRLAPFLEVLGGSTRRRWGPIHLRGLLGSDGAPLWRGRAGQADSIVGGDDAVLLVGDTALRLGASRLRLFQPKSWIDNTARRARAGVHPT